MPSYLAAWQEYTGSNFVDSYEQKYIRDHEHSFSESRALLNDEQQLQLAAAEAEMLARIDSMMTDVENMYWHASLKRTVEGLWNSDWQTPATGVQYALWDHMVPVEK